MRLPSDKTAALQQKEHGPHRTGVGADATDQFLLGYRVLVGESRKQCELIGRHAGGGKAGIGLPVEGQVRRPQRPGNFSP